MNLFYANGTPIINSLKVTSEVPLDPRLTVENIAERDSLVTNHISYDRMKVYVKSNDTKYIYHKDTGEWEIDNKFSEEDKSKLDRIDNYLIDTEYIYNPENKLLYREHSYDPNTDITTLRDHILQEARVSENGELYNGLLSKFYVNRLNNITNYLIDVSFTKGTDVPNLYLTTHSYNPDEDKTTLTNIDIPLATDDNHGLLSNLQNIKVNRIVDYVNRIDTTHTNAPDTGLTYNYNIYNPFTNANVTKTILIPLVTHTENGLTSSSDKIKIDDIETYVKSIALRQASGTEELGINYIITNPNDQTDTPGYFNIPLVTDSRNGLVSPARKHWMDNASGVSNTGTASDTWQLDKKDINTRLDPNGGVIIKDSGGIAEIRNNTDSAYSDLTLNNITIKGDVTQEGRSFITEAETVEVRDNTLLLNRGETGAGVSKEFAGIEIDRGSEPKYQILFDESDDRFKVGKEGDLWCVTLRDDEADMVNGMFTTWDSSTKRLKTTNIVPSDQKLLFGDNGDIELKYSLSKMGEIFSSAIPILNIGRKSSGYSHIEFGLSSSYAVVYTDALNGIYLQNQVLGRTFKRATDLSEVLYHADIVNNLTSGGTNKVLSAEQGKLLQNSITSIQGSYLPLSGGTMTGNIIFPSNKGIVYKNSAGTESWNEFFLSGSNTLNIGNTNNADLVILTGNYDVKHSRAGTTYKIWDSFNLPDPATLSGNNTFTGNNTFQAGKFNVGPFEVTSSGSLLSNISSPAGSSWSRSLVFRANNDIPSSIVFGGYNSVDDTSIGYVYIGIGGINYQTAQYRFYADKLAVPTVWSLTDGINDAITLINSYTTFGRKSTPLRLRGNNTNLIHIKDSTGYIIWDESNLPNPVTYIVNENNHATLKNKNGQYFTYIKAGTNGLLPHSKATLTSGGSGSLGTSDQSFNAAYINNLHTNKVTFGDAGAFIDNQSGDSSHIGIGFYTSQNAACPVYVGSLCVSDSYANGAPNIPTNGIYSKGNIYTSSGIVFNNNTWTNDLTPNRNYSGYLQVLDTYNAANAGGPTNYGTVLQVNSRNSHWANQLWFGNNDAMYLRRMNYGSTTYGNWIKLATTSDLNSYLTKTEASTLYYPYNGRGYLSITSTGKPVMSNNQGYAVKDKDGNEREVLWMGTNNALYLGNTSQYTLGQLDLRCTTLTHNGNKIATQNYVTNQLSNYLPLTGGTLTGNLTINAVGSTTLVINNNDTNGSETFMRVLRKGTASAAIGFRDSLGAYIYNYNSNKYLFIDNDGYARVGTASDSTRLALITDIPSVSGYLPLSGGTMTGALTMNSRKNNAVIDVVGGTGNNWNGGAGALSVQVPGDGGQTPLLVARRSGAAIDTTTAAERLLSMELLNTGNTFRITLSNTSTFQLDLSTAKGFLFGKTIATTDQIPSIPSISISNSGSGNAVTSITASGHTLTVTKGATYLTSSSLDGYATQTWANGQFAPLSRFNISTGYTTIKVTGQEFNFDSTSSEIYMNYRTLSGSTAVTKITWRAGGGPSSTALCEGRWGNLYMNDNLVATQSWVNNQGYLTSHQTIYNLTFQAGTFSAKTFDPNGAAATVNIPTKTSHITNDIGFITSYALNGYATQSWANGQFASLALYNTTRGYSTIRTTGNEICIGNTAATSDINQILVNYRVPSGCTYAPASWVWRAGSSSSYAVGYWGDLYMNDNLVATQTWSNSQYPLKTGTGASGTWDINISGNASTASAASKLGSTTIGGSAKPIYLSSGTPTECSATVGSATVPVYMNAGTITQCSTTLGVSITGNAATATKWNGYSIWTGTEDELPSSRDANTLYFVKKSQ